MAKLIVEVCKVDKIEKHPNANKLSIATIKGWNCIIGLNQYQIGNLVVYCPPDSIIPDNLIEQYNLEYLKKDGRVKTVKLRGYVSQGLILDIPEGDNWKEGQDVAKLLGIAKYEVPLPNYQQFKQKDTIVKMFLKYKSGNISFRRFIFKSIGIIRDKFKRKKNPNPHFHKYTDISNYRHYPNLFTEQDEIVLLEKIHGSNARYSTLPKKKKWFSKNKWEFCYGSHRVQLIGNRGRHCWYGEDIYGQIAERYKLAEIIPEDYLVYGEIYGHKIQDLEYGLKDRIDVVFFDVKYRGEYLDYDAYEEFCRIRSLPMVPVLYIGKFNKEIVNKMVKGKTKLNNANHIREGIIIRSLKESWHPKIGRKILKYKSDAYLIREKGTEYK